MYRSINTEHSSIPMRCVLQNDLINRWSLTCTFVYRWFLEQVCMLFTYSNFMTGCLCTGFPHAPKDTKAFNFGIAKIKDQCDRAIRSASSPPLPLWSVS